MSDSDYLLDDDGPSRPTDARVAELEATAVVLRKKLANAEADIADIRTERDRLRVLLDEWKGHAGRLEGNRNALFDERDRLRAVVVAAHMVLAVIDSARIGQVIDGIEGHDEITLLREKLAALRDAGGRETDEVGANPGQDRRPAGEDPVVDGASGVGSRDGAGLGGAALVGQSGVAAEQDRLRAENAELEIANENYEAHIARALDERDQLLTERDELRAVVETETWAASVVMQIMKTIDGGRRTWGDPLGHQVIVAVAGLEAERDRLRAFVAELCDDCNHPRTDHAFRGKPDACAWQHCSCKGYVAEPVALDASRDMNEEATDE